MKPVCERCQLPNKTIEMCRKRMCHNVDMPPPPPLVPPPESKWHFEVGDIIGNDDIKIEICYIDKHNWKYFNAKIVKLNDTSSMCGHYGSYITRGLYYRFIYIGCDNPGEKEELIWEVPDGSNDRFHREGSTGAQFLLYWFDDYPEGNKFSFDLDS